jgi:RNA polymerase sigma-70 factor (ECF subfamily)
VSTIPSQPDASPRPDAADDPDAEGELDAGAEDLDALPNGSGDHGLDHVPPALRGLVNSASQEASNREVRRREAEEDRELIGLAQKGDKAAFRKLVDRHQRRAFAIAVGLVRDENDAREIVQEAFLRVYRGLNAFQGGSSFFTWLYRIVTNLAIDLMRKPGRRDAELLDNQSADEDANADFPLVSRIDGADPIDVMRRREIAKRIQAALDSLPPYHRGVILMREVEGMSYEEMAQAMGVSKGTIMSRLFHARQKMQRALADCYAEEGRTGVDARGLRPGEPGYTPEPPAKDDDGSSEEVA